MRADPDNQFRPLLEEDSPPFLDRVNTPWDEVPDFPEYNRLAYSRIVRALGRLSKRKPKPR